MADETRNGVPTGHQNASHRASGIAAGQFGPISRPQLLEAGFSKERIRSWLRDRRLHPRYPGVYIWGRPDTTDIGDMAAALLWAGAGSALGGLSCLWWRELLNHRPRLVHVDSPTRTVSHADVRVRHPQRVERELRRDLPVVPLPAALLTASAALAHNSLRLVLARAEFKGQLHLSTLQSAVGEGRRGSVAVRAAMDAHLPQLASCVNRRERSFVLLCESLSLPIPEPNSRIGRYRPDMLWREAGLVVELDGRAAHHTPAQLAADAARQAALEALGYTVIRFAWAEVMHQQGRVAARVRTALAQR